MSELKVTEIDEASTRSRLVLNPGLPSLELIFNLLMQVDHKAGNSLNLITT